MELTDDQLWILLCCDIITLWYHGNPEEAELQQLGLLTLKQLDVEPLFPDTIGRWELTNLGHEVLQKDVVRMLHMLPLQYATTLVPRRYFSTLPIEALPSLLVHKSVLVRVYAKERMEELNGTN